jgi:protein TonB
LRFINHIAVSLFLHILLFFLLITLRPEIKTRSQASVIDVNIIPPAMKEPFASGGKRRPLLPAPPSAIKKQDTKGMLPAPPPGVSKVPEQSGLTKTEEDETPPKTIFGDKRETASVRPGKEGQENGTAEEGIHEDVPGGSKGLSLRPESFLFDKEVIEKYARKGKKETKELTFDVPEFHHRGYMKMLKEKIERIWKYPRTAAMHKISGDLYIRFSIMKDGSVGEVKLLRTSGHKELDEAAMKAIKDAEPYWPLPDDWEQDDLTIKGHFIYIIGGLYML